MNSKKITVTEHTVRIGREPQRQSRLEPSAEQSFLNSCDPYGIPLFLRQMDAYIAAQNRFGEWIMSMLFPRWMPDSVKVGWLIILLFGPAALCLKGIYW